MLKEQSRQTWLALIGVVLLSMTFGYLLGRLITVKFSLPDIPITIKEDTRPLIPVVRIHGIRSGTIEGIITGEARVFFGDDLVLPNTSGAFVFPPDIFLKNIVDVLVPKDMKFVASKRGKKYYPIGSSAGEQLVPQNRLYFTTEAEAEKAGYVK